MNRDNTILVDGAFPSVALGSQAVHHTALLKVLIFESWFELLCRLAKDEVHTIVLLLMWVDIRFHLELVLNGHLGSIKSRSILVKLRRCVHY